MSDREGFKFIWFSFSFVQLIKYYAEGETKYQTTSIVKKQSSRGVEINQKRVIHINLDVPSFPPTDEMSSNIIKITYFIRVGFFSSLN